MGFIYKDMRENTETFEKGRRKFSMEVRKKLLLDRKKVEKLKRDNESYPDISNYLHDRRRSTLMLKSMYNPRVMRKKYSCTPVECHTPV